MSLDLEISYRKGKAYAGYLHLRTFKGLAGFEHTKMSKPLPVGIVLDSANDQLIGIEILNFNKEVVTRIETALRENHIVFEPSDLAPILRELDTN